MVKSHSKQDFLPELNGLRGFSMLLVMTFHAGVPYMHGTFVSVDLFFALSGFLITTSLLQAFDRTGTINLKHFYIRRALRLIPALVVMLGIFCLVSFFAFSKDKAMYNYVDSLIALFYLSNWARAFSIHPSLHLGHTWSLSVEEQFYFIWPVTILFLLRKSLSRRGILIAAVSLALLSWFIRAYLSMNGASVMRLYNGLDTRLDSLMAGASVGILLSAGMLSADARERLGKWLVFITPVAAAGLAAFCHFGNWGAPWMYKYGFASVELMSALLILGIVLNPHSLITRFFRMRWLVWVGTTSYGTYLWHWPIYQAMFGMGFDRVTVITAGTLLTFGAAALSWYLIEKPALRLKRYFSIETPPRTAQTPGLSGTVS